MAEESKTQGIGGFEAISNFLIGKGPEGGLESQGSLESSEFPIIDPSAVTGRNDDGYEELEEEEETEGKTLDTEDEEEDITSEPEGETSDLSEFETDITKYLNEQFSKKLGWELNGEDAPTTIEEFVDFMNTIVDEASKPEFANEELEQLNDYIKQGGNIREFYKQIEGDVDINNIDIEDTYTQKQVIRENFVNLGYKEDRINKMIKRYEEAGVLEDEATDALESLKEYKETTKKKLLEEQKNYHKVQQEQQQKFVSTVQESIKGIDDILGVKVSEKEKRELEEYVLLADKTGMTQFQKEMLGDIKKFVSSAYYTKKGGTLLNRKQKQGETEAVKNLHRKLNANKGNPGSKSGNLQSSGASDGLSLLSSMLKS